MFKIGDRVLVDWEGLRGIVGSLEFKHFKNLLTREIKHGDGSLEIFEIENNQAGLAGWSGSALLGLIYVSISVLIKANPVQHDFEEVFLLDGLRLVAQENMAGEWYIYLLHDVLRSPFPVTTVASASSKEQAIVLLRQIASDLGNYEFPRATTKAISDLREYLKNIKKRLKTNPAKYGDANGDAATELLLYIENDGDLYRQRFIPIVKNLQKKLDKGTFDSDKAIKFWMSLIDAGAKKYAKEFGSPGDKWNDLFNKATRLVVAHGFNESFLAEIKAGNRWDI